LVYLHLDDIDIPRYVVRNSTHLYQSFIYFFYFVKNAPANFDASGRRIGSLNIFFIRCPSEADEDEAAAFSDTAVANAASAEAGGCVSRQRRRSVPPTTANLFYNEPPVKMRPPVRKRRRNGPKNGANL
jgi:hypothetical protein